MRRVMLVTLGSTGCARESMAFLLLRGLARPGRSRGEEGRHEDLQQECSDRVVEPVRGSRDRSVQVRSGDYRPARRSRRVGAPDFATSPPRRLASARRSRSRATARSYSLVFLVAIISSTCFQGAFPLGREFVEALGVRCLGSGLTGLFFAPPLFLSLLPLSRAALGIRLLSGLIPNDPWWLYHFRGSAAAAGSVTGHLRRRRPLSAAVLLRRRESSCSNRWAAAYTRSIRTMVIRFSSTS